MKLSAILGRAAALLLAVLITAAAALPVIAAPGKTNLGEVLKVDPSAVKIDAEIDDVYKDSLSVKAEVNSGTEKIYADVWFVWSDGFLYMYAEVHDTTLTDISAEAKTNQPWTADSIECFIDDDNDGKNYGMQYRVDFTGYGTWKDRNANKNYYTVDVLGDDFKYAANKTDYGYSAEMRMPMAGSVGSEIGINIQVNGISSTSYLVKDGWNTPEYPFFKLGVKVETTAAATTPAAGAAAAKPKASPQTFDVTGVMLISLLSAGAILVSRRRR
ncbi:MAG: hypothetical protein GX628_11040 [Clostridiales bacterium]|nr:hypothetical protein [Clostridiales bacterium]